MFSINTVACPYVEKEQDSEKRHELIDFCKFMSEPDTNPTQWTRRRRNLRYVATEQLVYPNKLQSTDSTPKEAVKYEAKNEHYELLKERKDILSKKLEVLQETRKALEEYDSVLVQMLLR